MSIQEKREVLKNISAQAAEIRENLLHQAKNDVEIQAINELSINDIIVKYIHTNDQHKEFNTFKGWLKEGRCVKKGETAFLVWGRPKAIQEGEKQAEKGRNSDSDTEEETFFPVSFIFSKAQTREVKETAKNSGDGKE